MSIKNGEVYFANLTGLNGVLSGVRAVIVLDVKSDDEILVMPISHKLNKKEFKSLESEVELELDNPVSNKLEGTDIVNGSWAMYILKNRLLEKVGKVKSIKMKMTLV